LSHQHDFITILAHIDMEFKDMVLAEFNRIYSVLYDMKIKDLYEIDMSKAADGLRKRFRKQLLIEDLS
jgi:hypothetical protein